MGSKSKKSRIAEKRFDVCDECGEVLAFAVVHHMIIYRFGLSLIASAHAAIGEVIAPSYSLYQFVRVQ